MKKFLNWTSSSKSKESPDTPAKRAKTSAVEDARIDVVKSSSSPSGSSSSPSGIASAPLVKRSIVSEVDIVDDAGCNKGKIRTIKTVVVKQKLSSSKVTSTALTSTDAASTGAVVTSDIITTGATSSGTAVKYDVTTTTGADSAIVNAATVITTSADASVTSTNSTTDTYQTSKSIPVTFIENMVQQNISSDMALPSDSSPSTETFDKDSLETANVANDTSEAFQCLIRDKEGRIITFDGSPDQIPAEYTLMQVMKVTRTKVVKTSSTMIHNSKSSIEVVTTERNLSPVEVSTSAAITDSLSPKSDEGLHTSASISLSMDSIPDSIEEVSSLSSNVALLEGASTNSLFIKRSPSHMSKTRVDDYIHQCRDEQERVQKKTFVNWINSYLSKRNPPRKINDLFEDLKDGTNLLALLEVLSGEKLPIERAVKLRRPHFLSNVDNALKFLESKKIKLVNINPTDLVDGRPAVVLGLIWTIILYFQIEEGTRALLSSSSAFDSSTCSLDSLRSPTPEGRSKISGAKKSLLKWVKNVIPKDSGIEVEDFGPSWRDGILFLNIINTIRSNIIDIVSLRQSTNRHRLETAFTVAENDLGISRLLDPEDVDVDRPDERSVMTYVAQFVYKYPEVRSYSGDSLTAILEKYDEFVDWLMNRTQFVSEPQNISDNYSDYLTIYNEKEAYNALFEKLKNLVLYQGAIGISLESWKEIEKHWRLLETRLYEWRWALDDNLPSPFDKIGEWLIKAESLLHTDEIAPVMNEETAKIISKKLEEHKVCE